MNAKQVLGKIVAMLSSDKEVAMTYAKLADGTILESNTFDVGELVEVVSEDGTKSLAPDGEHELFLKDSEGNEVRIKVMTKDGVITERENVELEAETVEVEPLPNTTMEPKENEVTFESADEIEEMVAGLIDVLTPDAVSSEEAEDIATKVLAALEDKIEILKSRKATKMAAEDEEVEPIPADEDKVDMKKMMEDMAYRISEMEKKFEAMLPKEEEEMEEEEEELPKLDGAPVEESMAKPKANNFGKKVSNSQTAFLSKLYK
jgi:hypothetical protein